MWNDREMSLKWPWNVSLKTKIKKKNIWIFMFFFFVAFCETTVKWLWNECEMSVKWLWNNPETKQTKNKNSSEMFNSKMIFTVFLQCFYPVFIKCFYTFLKTLNKITKKIKSQWFYSKNTINTPKRWFYTVLKSLNKITKTIKSQ